MGKYESMLRRTTQVEMSVGILRSRFETYPPQQFDLTVLEEDALDTPITLGNHVVASGPRTLEERIKSGLLNSEVRLRGHACAFRPHIYRWRR